MLVKNLKVLHMEKPLAIDVVPYFSWMMESDIPNTMQESYQLTIKDTAGNCIYDSGVVESSSNAYIPYKGAKLQSKMRYLWTVRVSDNHGNTATATSSFETGLLSESDWSAKWVKAHRKGKKGKPGFGKQQPATLFRKQFALKDKPVKARLYATCHGTYELYLNGSRADSRLLAPEHTVYEKYLCYQTYDVTEQLTEGSNAIGMHVGDGWYLCPQSLPNMKKMDYAHAILFQLEITYPDDSMDMIISDEDVKCSNGPVLSADLYAGEYYDANKQIKNWNCADFMDSGWTSCMEANYGYENLVSQIGEPVVIVKELPVSRLTKSPKGEWILDFGQNIAGFVRMKVNAPKGTQITLEHCEILDKQGNFFNNIQGAGGVGKGVDQKDVYVCDGTSATYEPHFTYHGFRYVRVTGIEPKAEDFTACVVSTEKENLGTFKTSDERLNRFYENIRWSQCANMLSVPTDCPQREKAGWTGDMLVYSRTALLNEDCTAFFTRWLYNMECDQDEYGIIPMVVPQDGNYPSMGKLMSMMYGVKGSGTSSGWGDAAVVVPYSMYEITGNTDILRQQYYCMRRWCDYIILQAASNKPKDSTLPDDIEKYLWDTGYHYGEWLIPSQSKNGLDMKNLKNIMSMSSCYTAPIFGWNSVHTFAKIAEILSEETDDNILYLSDMKKYQDIADRMKEAIQKGVIKEDGSMPSDLMGAYVLPIYFNLVPKEHKETFAGNLVKSVENNDMCMDTGFLTTPYLLDALCKIGRIDLAYTLLWQSKKPSWLYEVDAGGTTIWENCNGYDDDGNPGNLSFNHYAFGAVADWIFRTVGGIDTKVSGFKHLRIAPKPDGKIRSSSRSYRTEQGTVVCEWNITKSEKKNIFSLHTVVPCNTVATIELPDGTVHDVGSGEYRYEVEISL